MSDWDATHSSSINEGLDVEMPDGQWLNQSIINAMLAAGNTTQHTIAESATRILWGLFQTGLMDNPNRNGSIYHNVSSRSHIRLARRLAATSSVLLQNKGDILPLDVNVNRSIGQPDSSGSIREIAVFGAQAVDPIYHGGCPGAGCSPSSGQVKAGYVSTPLVSLRNALAIPPGQNCSFTNRTAAICVRHSNGTDVVAATQLAAKSDVAIVFVGCTGSEGRDRPNLTLGSGQDELIEEVARAQLARHKHSRTIVVAVSPGPILTPWRDSVAAIIAAFMPGQEYGNAIVDILLGKLSPAGKLPVTFPAAPNQYGFTNQTWCGQGQGTMFTCTSNHSEGLEIGYRWFDAKNATPAFPFGAGLPGYSTFRYSDLLATPTSVSFTLQNTGSRTAAETPQLYLAFPPSAGEPPWQLKGFQKTTLASGDKVKVVLPLTPRDLSIWSVDKHNWIEVEGRFGVAVGSSSRDHRLVDSMDIHHTHASERAG